MALLDMFKKKKNKMESDHSEQYELHEPLGGIPAMPRDPDEFITPQPYQTPGSIDGYRITFRDAHTGKTLTDTFPANMLLSEAANRLEREKVLSFPACYIQFPVKPGRPGTPYGHTFNDLNNVHSGMTVTVDISPEHLAGLHASANARRAYPLTFFKMENNVCVERMDFTGYGFENAHKILSRMRLSQMLDFSGGREYRILYWPTQTGKSTVNHVDTSMPRALCEFNPDPGKIFILEAYQQVSYPPMHTLYGCPAAALPEQKNALQDRCVDVIHFD